ncbi:hypothetical protein VH571_15715 [Frondihabitans sp. 4ASC-45]|uniref:hypothetical protein n=1 Tax=Frondihabitans sp. 4ASC-45 TaxID=3111636 RepID=UPI003C1580F9
MVTKSSVPKVVPYDLPSGAKKWEWPGYGEPPSHQQVPYEWAVTNFAARYFRDRFYEHEDLQQSREKTTSSAVFMGALAARFGLSRSSVMRTIDGTRWLTSADVGRFLRNPETAMGMRDVIDHYRLLHKSQTQSVESLASCVGAVRLEMLGLWRDEMTSEERVATLDVLASAVGELLTLGAELELSIAKRNDFSPTHDVKWIQLRQFFAESFGTETAASDLALSHMSRTEHVRRLVGNTPTTVAEVFMRMSDTRPDVNRGQVASTLSQLYRQKQLERVSKGIYRQKRTT